MEFLVPHTATEDEVELARITVVAHVVTPRGGVDLQEITLPLTLSPVEGGRVDPEVRKEVLLVEAARTRKEALERRDAGDYAGAGRMLRSTAAKVRDSGLDDEELLEEARDLEASGRLFEEQTVLERDVKYMKQRAYSSMRSRSDAKRRIQRGD